MSKLTEKDLALMDKYILGSALTPVETKEMEEQLKNHEFQQALRLRQDIQKALQVEGRKQLKAEFQTIENEIVIPKINRNPRNRYIGIAAGILILILGGLALFNPFQPDTDALFATYYKPYPNVVAPISKGEENILFYEKAFQLYEIGDYEKATAAFDSLYQNETVLFYQGLTLLQLNEAKKAQDLLEQVVIEKGEFGETAQWFLALTYLKRNKRKKAKALLQNITQSPYHKEATALYNALD